MFDRFNSLLALNKSGSNWLDAKRTLQDVLSRAFQQLSGKSGQIMNRQSGRSQHLNEKTSAIFWTKLLPQNLTTRLLLAFQKVGQNIGH